MSNYEIVGTYKHYTGKCKIIVLETILDLVDGTEKVLFVADNMLGHVQSGQKICIDLKIFQGDVEIKGKRKKRFQKMGE